MNQWGSATPLGQPHVAKTVSQFFGMRRPAETANCDRQVNRYETKRSLELDVGLDLPANVLFRAVRFSWALP